MSMMKWAASEAVKQFTVITWNKYLVSRNPLFQYFVVFMSVYLHGPSLGPGQGKVVTVVMAVVGVRHKFLLTDG